MPNPEVYTRSQHTLSRSKIDPDALKIMYRLIRHGFRAYLVGGGVRDVLLGKSPKDFDIATDATPRQVKSLFRNSRIIGRRFKLVHVFFTGAKNIEVSTFRDNSIIDEVIMPEDSSENNPTESLDNRIKYTSDNVFGTPETDALRRDITINALFYNVADYSIIDFVGGIDDLKDGIIRVIGDPLVRFKEDPVRMLRVVRHAARTGFSIEENCYLIIKNNYQLLKEASQVRVYEELKKDLTSGYILNSLRGLQDTELLPLLLPRFCSFGKAILDEGAHLPICLERIDETVRSGIEVSATVVLATLFLKITPYLSNESDQAYELGELIRYVFEPLLVPRKERERIEALVAGFDSAVSSQENETTFKLSRFIEPKELTLLYKIVLGDEASLWLRDKIQKLSAKKKSRTKVKRR